MAGLKRWLEGKKAGHEARHRPSGFGFALADRLSFLDAAAWDAAVSGGPIFLKRGFLESLEDNLPEGVVPRYALVYRGRRPAAAVAAQLVSIDGSRLLPAPAGKIRWDDPVPEAARKLGEAPLRKLKTRMLVCGNLFATGPYGVSFAPGEDPSSLWPAVAEALYRIRRADRLSGDADLVLVKDFPEKDGAGAEALRPFSYRPLETDPDMVLSLPPSWRSYNDYLQALNTKYRRTATQVDKDVAAAGYVLERRVDPAPHAARIHALYRAVYDHAGVRLAAFGPDFVPSLSRALGDDFRCALLRGGSSIDGFVTALRDGDRAVGYYIGFDYEANKTAPLYFRLLQAVIEDALEWGVKELSFSRTALEPKARLGAKPRPLRVWVRHRIPMMNVLLRGLLGAVPHNAPPERNPFK